jgi:branched-chain amino acid aminotransferase
VGPPGGGLAGEDSEVRAAEGRPGPVTTNLHAHLTDIQFGRREDAHGWMYRLL